MAFVIPLSPHLHSASPAPSYISIPSNRPTSLARAKHRATSASAKQPPLPKAAEQPDTTQPKLDPILSPRQQNDVLQGTMLENRPLSLIYSSSQHGFSNDSFFDQLLPLGGVPSLVLGIAENASVFGGYTANGFLARDDYRQASTARAMFVFAIRDTTLVIADNTDPIQYDFYDYAIRFGAGLLGIPMNPAKHIMKPNMATSSCRMPDGTTSLFGDFNMTAITRLEVYVAKEYVDQLQAKNKPSGNGFFARFFGS